MRALDFGPYEEIISAYGTTDRVFPLPDPSLAGPGLVIKPHKDSGRAEKETATVTSREDI
jgi:hypothetical protein